jgi:hypothetical protein
MLVTGMGCTVMRSPSVVAETPRAQVAGTEAPPVVAEFEMARFHGEDAQPEHTGTLRLWRQSAEVWRESPEEQAAEQWQLDGRTVFHTRYFHVERVGIEYQHDDLAMAGAVPTWSQVAQLVPEAALRALPVVESGIQDGQRWWRHEGMWQDARWEILWREDLQLPAMLQRSAGDERERITLRGSWAPGTAPWPQPNVENYRVIDFADLGDHERDPVVQRIQKRIGAGHAHAH